MGFSPLKLIRRRAKSSLGIDIGTSSVKIVDVSVSGKGAMLENYGELRTYAYLRRLREPLQTSVMATLETDAAGVIRQVLNASGVKTRRATMSIPLFSSFFTTLELPPMSQGELREAITYQARQIVPVPISEVVLDWEIVGRIGSAKKKDGARERLFVLLVAVPREIVNRYVRIAKLAAVELEALEVEAFSLARAALHGDTRPLVIADIGARSTSLLFVDEGTIRMSRSLDAAGSDFTSGIARAFGVEIGRAEAMKVEQGILKDATGEVRRMLSSALDTIINEIEKLIGGYQRSYGRAAEGVLLSGGSAALLGIEDYFYKRIGIPVSRVDPFRGLRYPEELAPALQEIGPSFTVAVGLALRRIVPANNRR